MRIFKTRHFARFARQETIRDETLARAIRDAESGLVAAELGGGLIKLRVARPGRGKSAGYRTLIAYSRGRRAVFLLGFAKNERENIDPKQLADLKAAATDILSQSDHALDLQIEAGRLQEVDHDREEREG
ncbi:MAG: type II toxin-antitoxin system RelE/ParE family toxin [Rhodomicrobium sp.]